MSCVNRLPGQQLTLCVGARVREHKDVALISLANVLHRAHYSKEAGLVVHAAIDVSRELNVNHFTLGNIYAVSSRPGSDTHMLVLL